jgi:hypothetical protein
MVDTLEEKNYLFYLLLAIRKFNLINKQTKQYIFLL